MTCRSTPSISRAVSRKSEGARTPTDVEVPTLARTREREDIEHECGRKMPRLVSVAKRKIALRYGCFYGYSLRVLLDMYVCL